MTFKQKRDVNRFPLDYVMSSMCPENIKCLFASTAEFLDSDHQKILFSNIVNRKFARGNNYLHDLISAMNEDNFEDVLEIVKVLVVNTCSMNTPNDNLETAFYLLLKKGKRMSVESDLIQFVLSRQEIDFLSNKSGEIASLISELEVDYKIDETRVRDYEYMSFLLEHRNERVFADELTTFMDETQSMDQQQGEISNLLNKSAELNLCAATDVLLEQGADVNFSPIGTDSPALTACLFGNFAVLKILLSKESLKFKCDAVNRNLLHQICMVDGIHYLDRERCFKLIVNDDRCTTSIINGLDNHGKSPLYYACKKGLVEIAENLLKRGAFIGHPSVLKTMKRKCLEQFLDDCINFSTDLIDEKCEVHVDYRFLMPPKTEKSVVCEVQSLQQLARSRKLSEVLMHPTITSFLQLKWQKFKWIAYANVFFYLCCISILASIILYIDGMNIFVLGEEFRQEIEEHNVTVNCITSDYLSFFFARILAKHDYIVFVTLNDTQYTYTSMSNDSETQLYILLFRMSVIGSVLLMLNELFQCMYSFKTYFTKFSNWLDMILIYFCFDIIFANPFCSEEYFRIEKHDPLVNITNSVVIVILILSAQAVQCITRVAIFSMSIHMAIFKKVLGTFLKTISLYMLPISAFAFSFGILKATENGERGLEEEDKGNFSTFFISLITSIRMMMSDLGAFDAAPDKNFQNVIFLLFIVLISIVLYNLLNALAISDTAKIMKHAELVNIKKRVSLIYSYEKLFMFFGWSFTNIFPQLKSLVLLPNVDRSIFIPSVENDEKNNCEAIEDEKYFPQISIHLDPSEPNSISYSLSERNARNKVPRLKATGFKMPKDEFDKIVNHKESKCE